MGDNGNGDKMVPEKDLLAVKASLQKLKEQYKAEKAELEKSKDTEYQARLKAEGSVKKVEAELIKVKASVEELDKVKADLVLATKSRDELSTSVIGLTRQNILDGYELTEDVQKKLEGMKTLEELEAYSGVLKDVGVIRKPDQKFAGGTGGEVDLTGKTGRDLIKEGLAQKE